MLNGAVPFGYGNGGVEAVGGHLLRQRLLRVGHKHRVRTDSTLLMGDPGLLLTLVRGVSMLTCHRCRVEGHMCSNFDSQFIFHDLLYSILGSMVCDRVCSNTASSHCDDADGPADSDGSYNVALSRNMRRSMAVQVPLDDFSLLAGIVDSGSCQCDPDGGYAHS
ncbi:hypothetical protein ABW21_db0202514 [Orbilia brochopaga]|nr:hypothetical protein ABW21_db0202514 [Drechslerella brochopaga]